MQPHQILIIGASGFIGQHTVRHLAQKGFQIFATFHSSPHNAPIEGVTWIPCNLREPGFEHSWPSSIETIVYMAQSRAWREFPAKAKEVLQINVDAPLSALEFAHNIGAKRFIFFSSGTIYTQLDQIAREGDPMVLSGVKSFYAASRLATEALLAPYAQILPIIVLRPFSAYGEGQDPKMLISQLIRRVREGQPIMLHGTDGLQMNPVYIRDMVEVVERCIQLDKSVTFNVVGPESLHLRQMGEIIGNVLKHDVIFTTQPDQKPPVMVGDSSAMYQAFGWLPQIGFNAGLADWLNTENMTILHS